MTKKEFIAIANYGDMYRRTTTENVTMMPHQDGHVLVEWKENRATFFPPNDRRGSFSNRTWDRYYMYFMNDVKWQLDYNMALNNIAYTRELLRMHGFTIRNAQEVIDEYLANRK